MGAFRFYRSQENDITIMDDRLFYAILDITRSDSESVDFSSDAISMQIYTKRNGTLIDSLTEGDGLTVSTAKLTFSKIFTELDARAYYYQIYNDTDKVGISHGKLIVI